MLDIDLRNLDERRIGPDRGFALDTELSALAAALDAGASAILTRREDPAAMLGWIDLPEQSDAVVAAVDAWWERLRGEIDDLVVLGIGGSSLGAAAVSAALPSGPQEARLHFVDNVDGDVIAETMERLDPDRTVINVISKSGTTAETMAAYLAFEAWLRDALGEDRFRGRIVVTTDPERGILRPLVREEDLSGFAVPESVGGRFSVLSPVGLVPLVAAGVDVRALLRGAAGALADLQAPLANSVVKRWAAAMLLGHRSGATIHVFMPYASRLRRLSDWYVQLWAESLGKAVTRDGARVHAGTTPLPAVGTTDQHAQVQLFNEGPFDKIVSFLRIEEPQRPLVIPAPRDGLRPLGYLGGRSFHQLLNAEQAATAHALAAHRRPNLTVTLPSLSAESLGRLLQTLMLKTALVGEYWNVDAFDQPGVELAKTYTYALMGRDGFDEVRAELREADVEV